MEILYITLGISIILNIFLIKRGIKLISQVELTQRNSTTIVDNTLQRLEAMLEEMRKLDLKGSFESDDEVGVVFKELKDVIETYKNII
jgi:hypothetical protein|tara:strand:- start:851 stop:1114 length:264 start_codon:yes stop_codon:yes gene_type:complete